MAETAPVISAPMTTGTLTLTSNTAILSIWNRAAVETWFVAGVAALAAPTVNGINQWYLPGVIGAMIIIPITQLWEQNEQPQAPLVLQAISASSINVWVQEG